MVTGYVYDKYDFILRLDKEPVITALGYQEAEASKDQGLLSFSYQGVNILMIWIRNTDATAQGMLQDTYQILQGASPDLTFVPVSEGDIDVHNRIGKFGSLVASNSDGDSAGGALIGSWVCNESELGMALTVSSNDATVLQVRFDRLLQGMECRK